MAAGCNKKQDQARKSSDWFSHRNVISKLQGGSDSNGKLIKRERFLHTAIRTSFEGMTCLFSSQGCAKNYNGYVGQVIRLADSHN